MHKPLKITQTLSSEAAQLALTHLSNVLDIPTSRVLEKLLLAATPDALADLARGSQSLGGVRLVVLDVPEQLAIMDSIAIGLRHLSDRVVDAAREGARDGVLASGVQRNG